MFAEDVKKLPNFNYQNSFEDFTQSQWRIIELEINVTGAFDGM